MTTLTIDIGGAKLAAALVDNNLQAHGRCGLPMPASRTPQALHAVLQTLVTPLQGRVNRAAITSARIIRGGALLALNPHNLDGLMHFPLTQTLEQITDLSTLAVNDAQVVAWAEYHALGGEYRDLVFVTVFTGVDGRIVSDGKLLTGVGGLAGYLGHTLADPYGLICGCRHVGCVEAITSGCGIAKAAEGALAGCDAKTIFSRAGQGNKQTSRLIHHSTCVLARLAVDVKVTADCQYVVIGGNVGLAEGYLTLVGHYLAQEPLAYHVELLAAYYRHDAGLLGAALLAQEE